MLKWSSSFLFVMMFACQPNDPAADPFGATSMVALVPSAPADNIAGASVQLTLRDSTGAVVPNRQVKFLGSSDVQIVQPFATDKQGQATATLTSSKVHGETIGARVMLGSGWTTLKQNQAISFYDPNSIPQNISLSLSQLGNQTFVADGTHGAPLTLSVVDGAGQVVVGVPVSFFATGQGVSFADSAGALGPLGTFTTTVASTKAELKTITAAVGASVATAQVLFVPGPLSPNQSRFVVMPAQLAADGVSQGVVRVTALDSFANPLADVSVDFLSDIATSVLTPLHTTTNNRGEAYGAVVASQTGTTTLSAVVAGTTLLLCVQVLPPQASGLYSRLVLPQRSVQADGISQVPVAVRVLDAGNRPVANQMVQLISSDPVDTFDPASGTTDSTGTFMATLTSQSSGAKTIVANFGQVSVGGTASFVPLNADYTHSSFAAAPVQVTADGLQKSVLLVRARDINNNPAAFEPLTLSINNPNVSVDNTLGQTDALGQFTATLTSRVNGPVTATATLLSTSLTTNVAFVAGSPNQNFSTLTLAPTALVADGVSVARAVATFTDSLGNPLQNRPVSFASSGHGQIFAAQAMTGQDGSVFTTVTSSLAESTVISATCDGITLSAAMVFTAGAPSSGNSSVSFTPATGIANGQTAVSLVVTVKDALGNAVPNQAVFLQGLSQAVSVSPSAVTTGADGIALASVRSTAPGTQLVRAQVASASFSAQIPFATGGPFAANSSFVALSPQVQADGQAKALFVFTVRDGLGQPVVNQPVTFNAGASTSGLSVTTGQTDSQGKASVALSATVADTVTVTATAGPVALNAQAQFVAGSISAATSSLTLTGSSVAPGTSAAQIIANGTDVAAVALRLLDAAGNPVAGVPVMVVSSEGTDSFSAVSSRTDGAGRFAASLVGTAAGLRTVRATAAGVTLTASLNVLAGQPTFQDSLVMVTPGAVMADGVAHATVTAKLVDLFGNAVSNQPVSFSAASGSGNSNASASNTWSALQATTNAQGQASVLLSSTLAERKIITAALPGLQLSTDALFVPGAISAGQSTLRLLTTPPVADGATSIGLLLSLRDANGNPIANQSVHLTSSNPSDQALQSSGSTDPSGIWTPSFVATQSGSRVLTVGLGAQVFELPITVVAGAPSMLSTLTVSPNAINTDDHNQAQVRVLLLDALGNPCLDQPVALSATGSNNLISPPSGVTNNQGVFTASFSRSGASLQWLTATADQGNVVLNQAVDFLPGAINISRSTVSVLPASGVADGISQAVITVVARDGQSNVIPMLPVRVVSSVPSDTFLTANGTTDSTGTFRGRVNFVGSGARTFTIIWPDQSQLTAQYNVLPGVPDSAHSQLMAQANTLIANGVQGVAFNLVAKDAHNNPVPGASVVWQSLGSGSQLSGSSSVTDAAGAASVTLFATHSGVQAVTASVGPAQLSASTLAQADAPSAASSTWTTNTSQVVADGVSVATLTLQAADALGNPAGGVPAYVTVDGTGNVLSLASGMTDASGLLTVTLASTVAESKHVVATIGSVNEPLDIKFVPGPPSSATSLVAVQPGAIVDDGQEASQVRVLLRDALGNAVTQMPVTLSYNGAGGTMVPALGQSDARGSLVSRLTATVPGSYGLVAQVGQPPVMSLMANIVILPGLPSAVRSTWVASPDVVVADGIASSVLTLTLADASGQPVPNQNVTISTAGGDVNIAAPNGVTDGHGVFTTALTSTVAQNQTISAQAGPATLSTSLKFSAGPVSISQCALALSSNTAVADGASPITVQLVAHDAWGNGVPNTQVLVQASGTGNSQSAASCRTNALGACSLTLASTMAESKHIIAQYGQDMNAVLSADALFLPGAANATLSVLTLDGNAAVADGVASVWASYVVRDIYGNAVPNQQVSFTSDDQTLIVVPSTAVTNAQGVASTVVTSQSVGSHNLVANASGSSAIGQATFVAGPVDVAQSSFVASPNLVTADDVSEAQLTVLAKDSLGHPVPGAPVAFALVGNQSVIMGAQSVTDASGMARARVMSAVVHVEALTAQVGGAALATTVTFMPGAVTGGWSTLVVSPNTLVADDVSQATLTLTLRDGVGNPVPGQAVTLSADVPFVGPLPQTGTTDVSGMWQAHVRATVAGAVRLTAYSNSVAVTADLGTVPGAADANTSALKTMPAQAVADGLSPLWLAVQFHDALGNALPAGVPVQFASSDNNDVFVPASGVTDGSGSAQTVVTTMYAGTKTYSASAPPATVVAQGTFIAGSASDLTGNLVVSPNVVLADGSPQAQVALHVQDVFGNPVSGANVQFYLGSPNSPVASQRVVTNGNGDAGTTFGSTVAASQRVFAQVGQNTTSVPLTFVAGLPALATSSLVASPNVGLADGVSSVAVVAYIKDINNNPVPNMTVLLNVDGGGTISPSAVTTDAQGIARATLQSIYALTQNLTVMAGSAVLNTAVPFVAGAPTASLSTLSVQPQTVLADGVATSTVGVLLQDAFGNPVPNQGVSFAGPDGPLNFANPALVTDANGRASTQVTGLQAGARRITATFGAAWGPSSLTGTLQFVAGTPNGNTIVFTASPNVVVADGVAQAHLLLRATDAQGNPSAGTVVSVSTTGTGPVVLSAAQTSTDATGSMQLELSSVAAQNVVVTANIRTAQGNVQVQTPVQFIPGAPSTAASTWLASPGTLTADGQATSTFSLTLRDSGGNLVPNEGVQTAVTAPAQCSPSSGVTDGLGHFSCVVITTAAGPVTVQAQSHGLQFSATAVAVPGPPLMDGFTLTSAPGPLLANGTAQLALSAVVNDAWGNAIPNVRVIWSGGAQDALSPNASITSASGTTQSLWSTTRAGAHTLSATLPDYNLSQNLKLSAVAGAPASSGLLFAVLGNAVVADGLSQAIITATVRDSFNNPVPFAPITWAATGSANVPVGYVGSSDANGYFIGHVASTRAEVKTITLVSGSASASGTVLFVAGSPNIAQSTLTAPLIAIAADGVAQGSFALALKDSFANPTPSVAVSFTTQGAPSDVVTPQSVSTSSAGTASATVSATVSGSKTLQATGSFGTLSAQANYVASAPNPQQTTLVCAPAVWVAGSSTPVTCTLVAMDAQGNRVPDIAATWATSGTMAALVPNGPVTSAAGVALATFSATMAQSAMVTATVGAAQKTFAISVVPAAQDAGATALTASPNQAVANGNSLISLTAHVADAFGNGVANQNVLFASSGNSDLMSATAVSTDALGNAGVTVGSLVAGPRTLTAQVGGQTLNVAAVFVPGPASMAQSQLAVSPNQAVADGVSPLVAGLVVRDKQRNPVVGQQVLWSTAGLFNTPSVGSSSTDGNGLATFSFGSTQAEAKLITATFAGSALSTSGLFVPGPVASGQTTFAISLSPVVADGLATTRLTVFAKDTMGNGVGQVGVSFSASGTANTFGQTSGLTDASGTYTTTLASNVAQMKIITASIASGLSLTENVVFVSGIANAALSTAQSNSPAVVANGSDQALVFARFVDAQGNPVSGQLVQFASTGANVVLLPASALTDSNGQVSIQVQATSAQVAAITLTSGAVVKTVNQAFVAGPISQNNCVLTLEPNTLLADGLAQTLVTVLAQDAFGNKVANQNVLLSSTGTANTITATAQATSAVGLWQARMSSGKAEIKQMTAQLGNVILMGNVTYLPGAPLAAASVLGASPNTLVADGQSTSVLTLALRDAMGNPLSGIGVTLAGIDAQSSVLPSAGITNAAGLFTTVFKTTLASRKIIVAQFTNQSLDVVVAAMPGPASAVASTLAIQPSAITADGRSTSAALFTLVDAFGNPLPNQNVTLSATGSQVVLSPTTGVTNALGQLAFAAASAVAQSTTLTAQASGVALNAALTLTPGPVSSAQSTMSLNPNTAIVADGATSGRLTLVVRDAQGNLAPNQPVAISVTGAGSLVPASGTSNAQGQLLFNLTSTVAELKTVSATLGSTAGSPVVTVPVLFVAGGPSSATSRLVLGQSSVVADGATPSSITVTIFDAQGNVVPNATVSLSASGSNNTFAPASGTTNAQGIFVSSVTSTKAQSQTVTAAFGPGFASTLTAPIAFNPGAVSPAASTLAISPDSIVANNVSQAQITLVLRDAKGNAVPNVAASFGATGASNIFSTTSGTSDDTGVVQVALKSSVAQTKNITAYFGAASLVVPVSFIAGPPSASTSTLTAAPSAVLADGTSAITLNVVAVDAFGNFIGSLPVSLSANTPGNQFAATTGTTNSQGAWSTTVSSLVAQSTTVTATLGTAAPASVATALTFNPGQPAASTSTLVASPSPFVANNVAVGSVTATVKDVNGNPVPNQSVTFTVSGSNFSVTTLTGTTNGSGQFAVGITTPLPQVFTVTTNVAGGFTLNASVTATPGPTAYLTLAGLAGGLSAATSSPYVAAFDALGNATPAYRGTVVFTSTDPNAGLPAAYTFTAADNGSHTFPAGATLVTAGMQSVTVQDSVAATISGSQGSLSVTAPVVTQMTLLSKAGVSQCLDLLNGVTANGTKFVSSACNNTVHQLFSYSTDNTLRVLGKCMEVPGGAYAVGQVLQAANCTSRTQQRFVLNSTGNLVAAGASNLCVDLTAANSNTMATLQSCDQTALSQIFVAQPMTSRIAITNPGLTQALEVAGGTLTSGTALQNNIFGNNVGQAFNLDGNGVLSIGNLCVQPAGGSITQGVGLALAACNGSAVQQWQISGTSISPAANAAYCMDLGASQTATQATLKLCNGSAAQTLSTQVASLFYRYVSQASTSAAMCLEVTNASVASTVPMISSPCTPSLSQTWTLNPGTSNKLQFMGVCADTIPGLLSVLGLNNYVGQPLYANTCGVSLAQVWKAAFVPGDSVMLQWAGATTYCAQASATAATQGVLAYCSQADSTQRFYQLARSLVFAATKTPALCMSAAGGLPIAGASLQYAPCTVAAVGQGFVLQADSTLTYSGLCVDVPAGVAAGSSLSLAACTGSTAQKWSVSAPGGTQTGALLSPASNNGLCADFSTAATGGAVKLASCSGNATQTITLR